MGRVVTGASRVRPLEAAWIGGLLLVVGLHAAAPISCTDFFWHLKLGQIIASEGQIPSTDMFSAVWPDAAYVQPQWLWEWLAAAVHGAAGFAGIRATQSALLVASFAALYWVVRNLTARGSAAYLIAWIAFMLFEDRFRARPDALTLGFVALSLPILFDDSPRPTRGALLYTFGLALFWANMHGGASVLLLLSLGALATGAWLDARGSGAAPSRMRASLWFLGVAALGLSASPTLIRGLSHWASLIGAQIQTGNEEWMPTYTALRQAITPCTILIAAGPSLVMIAYVWEQFRWLKTHGREPGAIGEWLLCAGYFALSQQAIRNVFLCVVPLVFMLRRRRDSAARWVDPALLIGAGLIALIALEDVVTRSYGGLDNARDLFAYDLSPELYPEEAADFLDAAQIEGGIFNDGKWGGYLSFRVWPKMHVFADSRQNFSPEMWQLYLATLSIQTRAAAIDAAFRRWGVELVMLRGPTFALGRAPAGFQLLYKAGDQEVYQHVAGAHARENLRRTRAFLSAHGARPDEDLTQAATRVGAERFLSSRFQSRKLAQAREQAGTANAELRAAAHVQIGETYYRAGLYPEALAALGEAQRVGTVTARAIYVDAFCSFAVGDLERVRAKLSQLGAFGAGALSRRQQERVTLLRAAVGSTQGAR